MQKFKPYIPEYSPLDFTFRSATIGQTILQTMVSSINQTAKIGASVEITDRCNAGCNYCYVYPKDWNQEQRLQGYTQTPPDKKSEGYDRIIGILQQLKDEGILHVTLVGGEPALAPKILKKAVEMFPIVWIVTNGSISLPKLKDNAIVFVSIDGPPDYHNAARDPQNFFANFKYRGLEGISAKIVKNINESHRGAYVHCTFTPSHLDRFDETISWLVKDIKKLRGIVISGATVKDLSDPNAFTHESKLRLGSLVERSAIKYGWDLFPFNTPQINQYLFDPKHEIKYSSQCAVSQRVKSLDYFGQSTGKCVLRNESICETCICNSNGLMRSLEAFDTQTMMQQFLSLLG
ncbi:radical SAM protein [Acaryochloris marina NIES-2412]|uniref:radical SAM protein n=1 Tax=Acaryochloris marina TaxID=155978 RepID=UPI004059D825